MQAAEHANDEVVVPKEDSKPPAKRPRRKAALKSEERIAEMADDQEEDVKTKRRHTTKTKGALKTEEGTALTNEASSEHTTFTMFPNAKTAIAHTQPPPHHKFDLKKLAENAPHYNEDFMKKTFRRFRIHPIFIEMFSTLRRIHRDSSKRCPIDIVLTVSMLEFTVAYARGKRTGDDLKSYITFIRAQWQLVGNHINLGNVPTGELLHILLAFATAECVTYTDGTDLSDKMKPLNHTLKYANHNIFHDYLLRAGYNCTKEEAQEFISTNSTRSDGCVECGLVKNGNDAKDFRDQVNHRFEQFSQEFKHSLKIKVGPSKVDNDCYGHFVGIHFTSGAGLLNVLLAALLTGEVHQGRKIHILVQSTRMHRMLFDCEGSENDVIVTPLWIICPHPHPNFHQQFLTTLTQKFADKLDKSYSVALAALDGVQINVQGTRKVFKARLSDSSSERRQMNKNIQEESISIDPEEREAYEEVKTLEKRLVKSQKFQERQKEKRRRCG